MFLLNSTQHLHTQQKNRQEMAAGRFDESLSENTIQQEKISLLLVTGYEEVFIYVRGLASCPSPSNDLWFKDG